MRPASRLAMIGATGRMGREIQALIAESGAFAPAVGVSRRPAEGWARVATSLASVAGDEVDLVIDFSLPEATPSVTAWCLKNKKPLISGVTGLGAAERTLFAGTSRVAPVLWSPNMSLGIAVMAAALKAWSRLDGFDFQIEELHHRDKKDRPSGTAVFLQDALERSIQRPLPLPIAIRGGGIFGVHRALAMGEEETLTIEHSAMNRRVFARGALTAALWIRDRPAGLYEMADVLGVK